MNRIYIIEFNIKMPRQSSNPIVRHEKIFYYEDERDDFIWKYKNIKDKDYITNIKCFYGELKEITDMETVINAI